MEENNNQSQRSVVDFSVVLSFVVSFFAIFSIAMFGFATNQGGNISYAAPLGTMPQNFNFAYGKEDDAVLRVVADGGTGNFSAPVYVAGDSLLPILCVEHNSPVRDGASYVRAGEIDDQGLLYILDNSFVNGKAMTDATGADAKYVENWVTQVAIWLYLYDTTNAGTVGESSRHYISPADLSSIMSATTLTLYIGGSDSRGIYLASGTTIYDKYVKDIVAQAKSASSRKALTVTRANGEISKTDDGKYYQTALVTVTDYPAGAMTSYNVSFGGVEGAFAVDGNGNTIGPNNIPRGTNFYVRVPVDKVKESLSKLTISVTGHFNSLTGYYYVAQDASGNLIVDSEGVLLQKVGSVSESERDITAGEEYELLGSPNTGMNTAQTIYFIGLIILLCGVGIVYANAKPVESKQ